MLYDFSFLNTYHYIIDILLQEKIQIHLFPYHINMSVSYTHLDVYKRQTHGGQSLKNVKRHPTIEDNVTIYSNASVLGGDTVVGEGSVIGGNTFIIKSVPSGTIVNNKAVMRFKYSKTSEDFNQNEFE